MADMLTPKQKAFADFFIQTGNATESAIMSGYSEKTARFIGSENLSKPNIKRYIDERMKKIEDNRIAKAEEVLQYLTRVLRNEETEQVVVTRSVGDYMTEIEIVEKKLSAKDRIKSAELLGKRYSLFNDKVNVDLEDKDIKITIKKKQKEVE